MVGVGEGVQETAGVLAVDRVVARLKGKLIVGRKEKVAPPRNRKDVPAPMVGFTFTGGD